MFLARLGGRYGRVIVVIALLLAFAAFVLGLVSKTYPVVVISAVFFLLDVTLLMQQGAALPADGPSRGRITFLIVVAGAFVATIVFAAWRSWG